MTDTTDKRAAALATLGGLYAPLGDVAVSTTDAAGLWGQYGGVFEAGAPPEPVTPGFLYRYHLYAAGIFDGAPTLEEREDDMLDFEDLGGVYNDSSAGVMSANVAAVNAFLAAEPRPALRFGGPRRLQYSSARVPGTAHFNASIVVPGQKPVIIDGGNSVLQFATITGVTPAVDLGTGGAGTERTLKDFRLQSNGSGIRCDAPGRGTRLQNIRIYPTCAGGVVLDYDEWTDRNTAGYGLQILDGVESWTPDGITIDGVQIFDSGGHGFFICDQLNAGFIRGRAHNCAGSGFKAENISGVTGDLVLEHNYAWGYHIRVAGLGRYSGGMSGSDTDRPNDIKTWEEANNWRGSAWKVGGHAIRQNRVRQSGAVRFSGFDGWASNKIDTDEGSRMSCVWEASRHVSQCVYSKRVQITDNTHVLPSESSSLGSNNFAVVWSNAALRPVVEHIGDEFVITYPAGCFAGASGAAAYWRPWGTSSLFTSQAGDVCIYEVEISGDANLVAWCVGREEGGQARQISNPCEFHIAPVSGGKVWPGLYNTRRRKLMGRVALGEVRTDVTPAIVLWADGYQDRTGSFPQSQALELTIHSWKFYVQRANGAAIP